MSCLNVLCHVEQVDLGRVVCGVHDGLWRGVLVEGVQVHVQERLQVGRQVVGELLVALARQRLVRFAFDAQQHRRLLLVVQQAVQSNLMLVVLERTAHDERAVGQRHVLEVGRLDLLQVLGRRPRHHGATALGARRQRAVCMVHDRLDVGLHVDFELAEIVQLNGCSLFFPSQPIIEYLVQNRDV